MSPETLIGMELGKGVLQRPLGQGTMGTVYLADQANTQDQIAIKVFLSASIPDAAEQEEFRQRLKQALALGTSLEHQHILAILDYGEHNGLVYETMPYIAGENLQTHLDRSGALSFIHIQRHLEQLASALDYAHGRNVLHRDLKPSNILLASENRLFLADFGLAGVTTEKNFARARQPHPGMLNYIAPEYVLSQTINQRADLYSLGAILYHMVTGVPPFQGASLSETAMKHVKATPVLPRTLRKDLPQAAEQVILRSLAKRPADRYSRAQDLAVAFRLALEAMQLLPSTEQAVNALTMLSDLASGGITTKMARVSAPHNSSLFNPKWQAISPENTQSQQPSQTDVVPPTPLRSALLETTSFPEAQFEFPSAGSVESSGIDTRINAQTLFEENAYSNDISAAPPVTNLAPKRTGLLRFADFPANDSDQTNTQQKQFGANLSVDNPPRLENQPAGTTEEMRLGSQVKSQDTTGLFSAYSTHSNNGENPGTIKLTEPVKIVQVPVVGQPGRFVTGFLPSMPAAEQFSETRPRQLRKRTKVIGLALLILIVSAGSGFFFWSHSHSNNSVQQQTQQRSQNASLLKATPGKTATPDEIILSDDLNQNIHNWPVGKQGNFVFTFEDGTYHIANNDKNQSAAALLPDKVVTEPFAYSLTIDQIKGDTTSPNNQFGMIFDANTRSTNGKQIDTFYALEILNKAGGEYQFWKYDNGKNSTDPWTSLWTKNFGKEFLQGSGPSHANTFKITVNGTAFTLLVNGKQVGTWKDSSFSSGNIGMLVNLNGAEVAFSHLLLTRL